MSIKEKTRYRIVLFKTVSAVMKAEKLLLSRAVPHKIIPVPKLISADCGICLRYQAADEKDILELIKGRVEFTGLSDI